MKNFTILFLFFSAFGQIFGQETGIRFFQGTLAEAQAKAAVEKKLIFMDCFTTWCGPCKMLDAQTFSNSEVGDFFNSNFICVKKDMEKGEGIELAKKFQVKAYPTMVFLASSGEMKDFLVGFRPAPELLASGKSVVNGAETVFDMQKKWEAGNREEKFLFSYVMKLDESNWDSREPLAAYLKEKKPEQLLEDKDYWQVFLYFFRRNESPTFLYVVEHRAEFQKKYGEELVLDKLRGNYVDGLYSVMNASEEKYDSARKVALGSGLPGMQDALLFADLTLAQAKENWQKFAEISIAIDDDGKLTDPMALNNSIWYIYENIQDPVILKRAVTWGEKMIKIDSSFALLDTYAMILYKSGNREEGMKWARKAIEVGKIDKEDIKSTEAALKRMKKKLPLPE